MNTKFTSILLFSIQGFLFYVVPMSVPELQ